VTLGASRGRPRGLHRYGRGLLVVSCLAVCLAAVASPSAQPAAGDDRAVSLEAVAPAVQARLAGQEHAQGLLFHALATRPRGAAARAVRQRLVRLLSDGLPAGGAEPDAVRSVDALGPRASRLVRGGFAFEREVMAIHASLPPATRRQALDAALRRYQSGPDPAIADAAKDMSILYDHPYTSFVPPVPPEAEPHRELTYPALTEAMWAARWYALAVLAPFEDFAAGAERDRALGIVEGRLRAKLSLAEPFEAPPTELPLAPAIAPGLVATHDRSAAVIDNLHMMLDVLADVLVHAAPATRRAAADAVADQFSTRPYRCVQVDEWIVVALRHSIFAQGGPALAPMTARERNAFSGVHGQHYGPRRAPPPCDP
jgi:hypothetical protein